MTVTSKKKISDVAFAKNTSSFTSLSKTFFQVGNMNYKFFTTKIFKYTLKQNKFL